MPARHHSDPTTVAVLTAAKALAQRYGILGASKTGTSPHNWKSLSQQINPALRAAYGVGPDTAAQLLVTAGTNPHRLRNEASFAALCGAAPVPASSGKITRHRLSRGGDRAANNALYRIALVRMSAHPQTRDYVQRQIATAAPKKRFCDCSNEPSPAKFRLLTRPTRSTTTATCGPPGKPKTSPSRPSPLISASRSSPSRGSNADTNATTPSPTTTANGSPPLDS